jgi:hypothetical protein
MGLVAVFDKGERMSGYFKTSGGNAETKHLPENRSQ